MRRSMIEDAKAKKNSVCLDGCMRSSPDDQTEVEGFRQCNIRDGAALCRYFAWLEEALGKGEQWNEFDAATELEKFRRWVLLLLSLTFPARASTSRGFRSIPYLPPVQMGVS